MSALKCCSAFKTAPSVFISRQTYQALKTKIGFGFLRSFHPASVKFASTLSTTRTSNQCLLKRINKEHKALLTLANEKCLTASYSSKVDSDEPKPVDVDRELLRYDYEEFTEGYEPQTEEKTLPSVDPLFLERGEEDVFDLGQLVAVLEEENARDICAISVPPQFSYVNYLVIVTARSPRHVSALAAKIQWLYKRKRLPTDPASVKIEGEKKCRDWLALDLGNIALHIFLEKTRQIYDLETLWTVGPDFDDKTRESDLVMDSDMTPFWLTEDLTSDPTVSWTPGEVLESQTGWHDIRETSETTKEYD